MHVYMYTYKKKKAKTEGEGAQPVELSVTAAQIVSLSPFGKRGGKKKKKNQDAFQLPRCAEKLRALNGQTLRF